jgi:two-component system phosphate regulon response regulator PhoB
MGKHKILLIEDDKHISKLVKYNLERSEYECTAALSGEKGLEILSKQPVDFIILDIMLPGIDGFEVCRTIKQDPKLKNIPIMIVGLELGADDYIVKPFSPRELLLRLKAILRRGKMEEEKKDLLSAGDLLIDIPKHTASIKNKEIELTPMEFKLLVTLLERRGRVQTRERLLSDVWEMDSTIDTRTIDTHVKRIRSKLGKMGKLIKTVRGMGYKFMEDDED